MDTLNTMSIPDRRLSSEQLSENISDSSKPKKHRRSRYDPEPDWSAVMREKITKSQRRVGQACDRCKVFSGFLVSAISMLRSDILT
jgi:hypothetical protein